MQSANEYNYQEKFGQEAARCAAGAACKLETGARAQANPLCNALHIIILRAPFIFV